MRMFLKLFCLLCILVHPAYALAGNENGVPPGPPDPTDPTEAPIVVEVEVPFLESVEEPAASGPGTVYSESYGCDSSGASGSVRAGGFGVSSPTYPCEIMRTYEAIKHTEGRGFLMGGVPRFFLRVRLITKGVFSAIFGLIGLG